MRDGDKSKEQLIRELEKLRQRVCAFEAIEDHTSDIAMRVDRELRYVYVNSLISWATGIKSEQFLARTNEELGMPLELSELWSRTFREVFQTGEPRSAEFAFHTPDGERHYSLRAVPEIVYGGIVETVLAIAKDDTARKRSEGLFGAREEQLRLAFDNAPVGEAIVGNDRHPLQVNAELCRFLGYAEDELLALTFPDYTHPEDLPAELDLGRRLNVGEIDHFQLEKRYIRKDGKTVWGRLSVRAVTGSDGSILYFVCMVEDITERKQVEEELRRSEAKFRSIFETNIVPIIYWHTDGRVLDANDAWLSLTGYTKEELKAGDVRWDTITPPEYIETNLKANEMLRRGEVPPPYEKEYLLRDGRRVPVLVADTLLPGYPEQGLALAFDLTERKRAEEALQDSSQKLKLFAYSVAHDLKSPTIGVYGLTKRLSKYARDVLDEKGRSYCDQILKLSEHIAALVEKINIYIATKETAPLIETANITEIFRMLRDEFSTQLSLRKIYWYAPESELEIRADRLSILRIFRNLIDNALKYGGDSLTRISIGYEDSEKFHIFFVSDNGKGLKDSDSEKIFGLFQRNETSRGVEGAGLGLTIVKEIAEQHGGKVWIESKIKKGTTFYISISKNI
jgi:PAS domain S-box-containing protein